MDGNYPEDRQGHGLLFSLTPFLLLSFDIAKEVRESPHPTPAVNLWGCRAMLFINCGLTKVPTPGVHWCVCSGLHGGAEVVSYHFSFGAYGVWVCAACVYVCV